jgi:recombinational DNA repair protein (RecF pathway)
VPGLFSAQQVLLRSVSATYIAEMVDTFAPSGDPAELIYRLLDKASDALLEAGTAPSARGPRPAVAVVAYVEVWMLRLAGTFPSTRTCIECGGEIGRPLRFMENQQGFVCDNCATREAFVISNDVADELDAIGKMPVADYVRRNTPFDVLFELRSLTGAIRRHFLGHELKSFDVLSSVVAS